MKKYGIVFSSSCWSFSLRPWSLVVFVAERQVDADVWVDVAHPGPSHHFYRVREFSLDRRPRVVLRHEPKPWCPALSGGIYG
jgi:hypothetical protein